MLESSKGWRDGKGQHGQHGQAGNYDPTGFPELTATNFFIEDAHKQGLYKSILPWPRVGGKKWSGLKKPDREAVELNGRR